MLLLFPAADLVHALMILPAVFPLLALVLEHAWRLAAAPAARVLVVVLARGPLLPPAVLAVRSLTATVAARPPGTAGLPRATGIWDAGPEFERMRGALAAVERAAPPGTPLLVLPNAQLAYVLADRVSALDADEIVLYFVSTGLLPPAEARALLPEVLAAVEARRPTVLIWRAGVALDRLRAAYPLLFELIERRYRVASEVDGGRVLVPID